MQFRDNIFNDNNNLWPKKESECAHPRVEEEFYLGSRTGDYVCKDCGKASWRGEDFKK